jgi:hypothetical protein
VCNREEIEARKGPLIFLPETYHKVLKEMGSRSSIGAILIKQAQVYSAMDQDWFKLSIDKCLLAVQTECRANEEKGAYFFPSPSLVNE